MHNAKLTERVNFSCSDIFVFVLFHFLEVKMVFLNLSTERSSAIQQQKSPWETKNEHPRSPRESHKCFQIMLIKQRLPSMLYLFMRSLYVRV